jgi:hypothetical protein
MKKIAPEGTIKIQSNGTKWVKENGKTVKQIKYYSHRLIAKILIENPHNYSEIDHINRDKLCNRIDNLRWCDRKTNRNNR